jgi:hypothetical protein
MAHPNQRATITTMNAVQRAKQAEKEANLAKALIGLADETYANVRQASRETGASRKTITRRFNGGKSRREAQAHRQSLSPHEEHALVKWIERLSCTGLPVYHQFLRELAEELRDPRLAEEGLTKRRLGKHWVSRFLGRNPSLQSKVAKSIEAGRIEVTEKQLWNWFMTFKHVVDECNIDIKNIYNMDETGSSCINRADCRF